MENLQGRPLETMIESWKGLEAFYKIYKEAEPRIYPKKVEKFEEANPLLTDESTDERKIQKIDECLNFLKFSQFLNDKGYKTHFILRTPPEFFSWDLPKRRIKLKAASVRHFNKCILMENKK